MVLLAHISDPHLGPLPPLAAGDLTSKRLIGYLNWKQNRGRLYDRAVVDALTADMRAHGADHIAVTGDLVNLALPAEFDRALDWLNQLGGPDDVTVIPGNHDAYVPGAHEAFNRIWRDFMEGDDASGVTFPFVRRRGPLALIGLSTAEATLPLMATGKVGEAQAAALARVLAETGRQGLFRIVLIHHPPARGSTVWGRRLTDARRFRDVIARRGAELILHGHNHRTSIARLKGPDGPVPVIGAAGASMRPNGARPGGSYNLFRIEGEPGAYTAAMTERRVTTSGTVETALERQLVG
ncbi:MAG: metallophosphoesterase [Bauldia sp.]